MAAKWNDQHARMVVSSDCRPLWAVKMLRTLWEADEVRAYQLVEQLLNRRKAQRVAMGGAPIDLTVNQFYQALLDGNAPG